MDDDPHASLGNQFKEGLAQWCTTKKASGIFGWSVCAVCRRVSTDRRTGSPLRAGSHFSR